MIVSGIDPHKQTHTAVAIDGRSGRVLAELAVRARTKGFQRLPTWARGLDDERRSPSRTAATSPGISSDT